MVNIPLKTTGAVDKNSVLLINNLKIHGAEDKSSIQGLNNPDTQGNIVGLTIAYGSLQCQSNNVTVQPGSSEVSSHSTSNVNRMMIPKLNNVVKKGQKISLESSCKLKIINACLGWNVKNACCDVDVSAFLLSGNKVISDDWFVFYGQPLSPDGSTSFSQSADVDREIVSVNFNKINNNVDKIVFVLTINEAFEKKLNFSMIEDAYVRLIDVDRNVELVSFMMDEYYDNVTSMMIGEIYKHNGLWKFNAVGNGVARDLAGLCELYGVKVD